MSFYTPLRYPGGKARLGPWLAELMRHNKISGGDYAEPYAGGAGAAIFLLMRGYVNKIHINDADPVVYAFWHAVTKTPARLVQLIRDTPVTMESWRAQQDVLAEANRFSHLRVGFAAFFLNRTNRSGILAGGVIGGKKQTGNYSIDARFNKGDLIGRIEAIGAMARSITVTCCDAKEWLTQIDLPQRSLLYLDPPYYVKGAQLYRNFYEPEDHAAIAKLVTSQKTPVVVTYDDVQPIRDLYAGMPAINFSLHYSTHLHRPKSTEVMFYRHVSLPSPPRMTRGSSLPPAGPHERGDVVPEGVHELLA